MRYLFLHLHDVGNPEGGCVGGQDGLVRADGVPLPEELLYSSKNSHSSLFCVPWYGIQCTTPHSGIVAPHDYVLAVKLLLAHMV